MKETVSDEAREDQWGVENYYRDILDDNHGPRSLCCVPFIGHSLPGGTVSPR